MIIAFPRRTRGRIVPSPKEFSREASLPLNNDQIAARLEELANLLEDQGATSFEFEPTGALRETCADGPVRFTKFARTQESPA